MLEWNQVTFSYRDFNAQPALEVPTLECCRSLRNQDKVLISEKEFFHSRNVVGLSLKSFHYGESRGGAGSLKSERLRMPPLVALRY